MCVFKTTNMTVIKYKKIDILNASINDILDILNKYGKDGWSFVMKENRTMILKKEYNKSDSSV